MTSNLRSVAWTLSFVVVLTVLAPTQLVNYNLSRMSLAIDVGPFHGAGQQRGRRWNTI